MSEDAKSMKDQVGADVLELLVLATPETKAEVYMRLLESVDVFVLMHLRQFLMESKGEGR